jgi:hypothetical protein
MKRTFVGITRSSIVLSSVLLLTACGGGGHHGGGDGVPNAAVGGLWEGTTSISGMTYDMVGISAEDGRGYFVQEEVMYWGKATSSGSKITYPMTGAGMLGWKFLDGSAVGTGSISGTIQARKSISANSTFTTASGTTTTGTVSLNYMPSYDDDSSLALIAGNYVDTYWYMGGVFNIASNGDLFFQDPGIGYSCVINGTVAIINPAYNAYDIQYSYSNCTGELAFLNGVTYRGLATYDSGPQQFIVMANGLWAGDPSGQVFVLERR